MLSPLSRCVHAAESSRGHLRAARSPWWLNDLDGHLCGLVSWLSEPCRSEPGLAQALTLSLVATWGVALFWVPQPLGRTARLALGQWRPLKRGGEWGQATSSPGTASLAGAQLGGLWLSCHVPCLLWAWCCWHWGPVINAPRWTWPSGAHGHQWPSRTWRWHGICHTTRFYYERSRRDGDGVGWGWSVSTSRV